MVRDICAAGGSARCVEADVKSFSAMEQLAATVVEQCGRIDILVNNAGITRDQLLLAMTEQDFREVIETNLCGAFNATRAVAQQMMLQKRGRIINISSVAGERGGRGQTNYAASKGGLNAFTRAAAIELAPKKYNGERHSSRRYRDRDEQRGHAPGTGPGSKPYSAETAGHC